MVEFCDDCEHLTPTEKEQDDGEKKAHYCQKYGKYVFHKTHHPKIVVCNQCGIDKYVNKKLKGAHRWCLKCGEPVPFFSPVKDFHRHTHREKNDEYLVLLCICGNCGGDNEWKEDGWIDDFCDEQINKEELAHGKDENHRKVQGEGKG